MRVNEIDIECSVSFSLERIRLALGSSINTTTSVTVQSQSVNLAWIAGRMRNVLWIFVQLEKTVHSAAV